ncbi:MAG: hypothetical protein ACOC0O_06165 [Spirochaetota bacterium]
MHHESEALIRLGMLLRKRRTPENRRAVEEVLRSALSSEEKARRITEIDRASAAETPHPARRQYVGTPEVLSHRGTARSWKLPRIKAPLDRQGYFAFLFQSRLRIREFGRTTRTIAGTFFPPSVRLLPDVGAFYAEFVRPTARDVHLTLGQLMGNAWMYLTKHDYNLLSLLLDLCSAIELTPLSIDDFKNATVEKRLRHVEARLLALRYDPDSIPRILEGIETLVSWNRRTIDNLRALPDQVSRLITRTTSLPSLIDSILAVNMVAYRRYLTEQDLTITGLGRLVPTEHFTAPEETLAQIEEFLDRLQGQLEALSRERREIFKVRAFIARDAHGAVDISPVRDLASQYGDESWDRVSENPVLLARIVFRPLAETIAQVLTRSLQISGIGTTPLFADAPMQSELERMRRAAESMEDLSFNLPTLTRDRFMALVDRRDTPTRFEAEFILQTQIYLDALPVLVAHVQPFLAAPSADPAGFTPVVLTGTDTARQPLPLDATIEGGAPALEGLSVRNAIASIIRLCHLVRFLYGDRHLRHLLKREHQIERDVEHLRESVERIAEPDRAEQILSAFETGPTREE